MFPTYTRDDLAVLLGCTTTHATEDYVLAPDGLWLRVDWHAWQGLTDQERSAIAGNNWPMPQEDAQGKPAVADDGTVLIGQFGRKPLLGFPVTALELWEFDRETVGTFSDYLPQDADGWMAERLAEGGPGNEAVVRLARVLLSDEPPQDEAQTRSAEKEADWMDHVLDATGFFALAHVPPVHAAMLLCRLSPHDNTEQDAETISTDETTPDDFKRLRLTFLDKGHASPGNRTLLDWLAIAEQAGRRTHSWARRYVQVRELDTAHLLKNADSVVPPTDQSASTPSQAPAQVELPPPLQHSTTQDSVGDADPSPLPEASPAPVIALSGPGWELVRPKHFKAYGPAVWRLLETEHQAGRTRPNAHAMLQAWRENLPPEIAKVMADGIDYHGGPKGGGSADLAAIQATIKRMTRRR